MSFDALIGNISIEDMKFILAGSGSVVNGSSYTQGGYGGGGGGSSSGNMWFYATDRGLSSQFSPAGTLLFSGNGDYNNPPTSSNQTNYGGSTYNTGSGGGGSTGGVYNALGWISTGSGIKTTNPSDISRLINFMQLNNAANTAVNWSTLATFLNNELTVAGRQLNDNTYGAIQLGNVTVVNNYHGPSTIQQGIMYENGVLTVGILMGSAGIMMGSSGATGGNGTTQRTNAVLTSFTRDQLVNSFGKINFAGMALDSVPDWDPIKKEYNYANSFQPNMKLNVEGAISIALYEQLSLSAYDNDGSTYGTATIGFGHKLHSGTIIASDPKTITFDQAISYYASDIIVTENMLNRKIENLDLTGTITRDQYFALFDMFYNAGNGDGNNSIGNQVLQALKSGGVEAANTTIQNAYLNADPHSGLMDRRYFEAQAFINGRLLTPEDAKTELTRLGLKK